MIQIMVTTTYFGSRHDAGMKEKKGRREKEVTEQEAFDFFTATWEEEKEETAGGKKEKKVTKSVEKEVSTSKGSEEEEEESEDEDEDEDEDGYETANEEEEEGDKKKLLASQYIGLKKKSVWAYSRSLKCCLSGRQYDWEVTEWRGPEIVNQEEREANEVGYRRYSQSKI